jgi:arabinogalactan endo-1,4-beta-galactosidase
MSTLTKTEAHGGAFYAADGTEADPLGLLAHAGMTMARLKVWVDPADGSNSAETVLAMAPRVKALGLDLLVDFHYSDFWADPGRQDKPAAWADLPFPELVDAVHDHTHGLLAALRDQGTPADMVQVGNEINGGMLWPDGSTDDWGRLAALLAAGTSAVRDAAPGAEVMMHVAEGGDNALFRWWFDSALAHGVDFDLIGVSYYPYWHGTLDDLRHNLDDISQRYRRDVLIAETAYGFTLEDADGHGNIFGADLRDVAGYPATPEGQAAFLGDLADVVAAVPAGRGRGIVYWEPAWIAVEGNGWDPTDPSSGNAWENQALFDYDHRLLSSASALAPRRRGRR